MNGAIAGNYGSEAAGSTKPATLQPIQGALNALGKAHNALHDRISVLTQRLEPVLAPQPPAPVGNEQIANRQSVAAQITTEADIAMGACQRIEALLNRLEL